MATLVPLPRVENVVVGGIQFTEILE